jgi:hypothetical protein
MGYWWIIPVTLGVTVATSWVALYVLLDRFMVKLGALAKWLEEMPRPATTLDEIFRMAGNDVGAQVTIIRMRSGYIGEVRVPGMTLASSGPLDVGKPEHVLWDIEAKLKAKEKLPS